MENAISTLARSFLILAGNQDNHKSLDGIRISAGFHHCSWASEKSTYKLYRILVPSFLNGSSSFVQVTRTAIKARLGLNFDQIGHLTAELAAFERLEKFL